MNKKELIDALAEKSGLTQKAAGSLLDALSAKIAEELKEGGELVLPGIGKFSVLSKEARIGRNPRTGEEVQIPARTVPKFAAAKALKDALL